MLDSVRRRPSSRLLSSLCSFCLLGPSWAIAAGNNSSASNGEAQSIWHFAPMRRAHKALQFPQDRIADISRQGMTGWRRLDASVMRRREFSGATEAVGKRQELPSGTPAYDWVFLDEWTIEEA